MTTIFTFRWPMGRHLALAAKRYLPVIVALHEFALGGAVVGKNGRLRVSRAETVLLSGLEGHEGIVFKGGENLPEAGGVSGTRVAPVLRLSRCLRVSRLRFGLINRKVWRG